MNRETRRAVSGAMLVGVAGVLSLVGIRAAEARIQVQVNGQNVRFTDAQPMEMNGRVLIPLRDVAESMNAEVRWNNATRTVHGNRGGHSFALPIGARTASVGEKTVTLDQPAQLIRGRTMVPLRFAAEAFGADVAWKPANQLVAISFAGEPTIPGDPIDQPAEETARVVVPAQTVVQVRLNDRVTSEQARIGDRFMATVDVTDKSRFPQGTQFEGRITEAQTATEDRPGIIDAAFERATLPNGDTLRIDGQLSGLDKDSVRKTADGRLETRKSNKGKIDWKWAGYGAGAGLILGGILGDDDWFKGALIGGLGGAIYAYLNKDKGNNDDQRAQYKEVVLKKGTKFGVLLNSRVALNDRL